MNHCIKWTSLTTNSDYSDARIVTHLGPKRGLSHVSNFNCDFGRMVMKKIRKYQLNMSHSIEKSLILLTKNDHDIK